MKITILGYGKEGKSAETYFQNQNHETTIYDHFTNAELAEKDFSDADLVLRSPSVLPIKYDPRRADSPDYTWSSMTSYFFKHCPCPIIGVTGTKGKGTTCSIIKQILETLGRKVWLVGNIGNPALDVLDEIQPSDVVIYEMSSFQLWDLSISPHVAVVLRVEPDHLNIHRDFDEYVAAKANIVRHQKPEDICIYYQANPESAKIAEQSAGQKIAYPTADGRVELDEVLDFLAIPGAHNRENAEAAIIAVAAFYGSNVSRFVKEYQPELKRALSTFRGLPHRLEFLRELNGVKYYDDNFSTTAPSMKVALEAFPENPVVIIAGGRDKTDNADLPEIAKNITELSDFAVLIGESGHELAKILDPEHFTLAENLAEAVQLAREQAEKLAETTEKTVIVLMSPAAASFDMFENVYDRGAKFQKLIEDLK